MKIEISDEALGDFRPFAVFLFKPPDDFRVFVISGPHDVKSVPPETAKHLLEALLKPEYLMFKVGPAEPSN